MQVFTITQHRDPTDRVRPIGHGDRQIGEHPPRRMHRDTPVGVDQRVAHRLDETCVLGHLPKQTDPSVRHHTTAVRADHNTTYSLATLHLQSARSLGPLNCRKSKFPKQDGHFRAPGLGVSQNPVKRRG